MVVCPLAQPDFLAPDDARPHTAVASYPRSGSSYTRGALEGLTGVWTGSDFCRNDTVGKGGARPAEWSAGEGVHDRRVWLVKTHSRMDTMPQGGPFAHFRFASLLLIVRHPLDVMLSFWSFTLADERHDVSVPASTFAQFAAIWDAFVAAVMKAWQSFHAFWLARADTRALPRQATPAASAPLAPPLAPALVVRYEELADKAGGGYERTLLRIHQFLYRPAVLSAPGGRSLGSGRAGGEHGGGGEAFGDAVARHQQHPPHAVAARQALSRLECLVAEGRAGYYAPRSRDRAAEARAAFPSARRRRVLAGLRAELCIFGYHACTMDGAGDGGGGGACHVSWGDGAVAEATTAEFACTEAERGALEAGSAAEALRLSKPKSASRPAASPPLLLALNAGNECAPTSGGSGPGGFSCRMVGAAAAKKARDKGAKLEHPFEALACVRAAARANGVDISGWDRGANDSQVARRRLVE